MLRMLQILPLLMLLVNSVLAANDKNVEHNRLAFTYRRLSYNELHDNDHVSDIDIDNDNKAVPLLLLLPYNVLAANDTNATHDQYVITWTLKHANETHKNDNHNKDKANKSVDDDNDDDDYYSDYEQSDSVNKDIDIDYAASKHKNWIRISPSPNQNINPTTTTTPTPLSSFEHLKRVPRHPHSYPHPHHNHLDGDAAFDEEGYQSDQPVGALTAQKQHEVGTPDMVQISRRRFTGLRDMANLHKQRIEIEARCRWPQARVINMNNETSKLYSPRATILHRCDEATGCCPDSKVCTVKTTTTVELPFWVISTGSIRSKAQMVALTNHTECECVNLAAQRRKRSSQCHCPKHFNNYSSSRWQHVGIATSCRCDCHLSDATCQRMKNGEEGFAMSERRCILHNECSQPICNYGVYNQHTGRCPRPSQQQQEQRQLGFG